MFEYWYLVTLGLTVIAFTVVFFEIHELRELVMALEKAVTNMGRQNDAGDDRIDDPVLRDQVKAMHIMMEEDRGKAPFRSYEWTWKS